MTEKGEAWLAARVRKRLHKDNLNFLVLFTGAPGMGKSWSAIRLGSLVDDGFDESRVVFDIPAFLNLITHDLPRGSFVVLDEAGLAMPSREWQSAFNRAAAYVLQSFRHMNLALAITAPDPSYLDRVPRTLFNVLLECVRVDRRRKLVRTRPYFIQHNPRLNKTYFKHPVVETDGGPLKIERLTFGRPAPALTDSYEEARAVYMKGYYRKLAADVGAGPSPRMERVRRGREAGMTDAQIGAVEGITGRRVNQLRHEHAVP